MTERLAYSFADGAALPDDVRVSVLGGKGAALARMTALGLPVPPGFTLTTGACHRVLAHGWSPGLDEALGAGLAELEAASGRRLGDDERPVLVSVRSGAPVSMPGMMDTVLNAGMTDRVAEALGRATGDARFGWDTARRFVQSYASVVLGAPAEVVESLAARHLGDDDGASLDAAGLRTATVALRADLADGGFVIPDDPVEQIRAAVRAVFASWNSERATVYREVEGIDSALGTAATVQAMTFGNLGERSGTGVVFSRDPSTGAPGMMGDFLSGAQGEDVVAGTHRTEPISALVERWPEVGAELDDLVHRLELDLGDLVDVEFTVEDGRLWLLQVRRGKRSPRAALRIAIDMAEDPSFPLDRAGALARVADVLADPPTIASTAPGADAEVIATGLAASPGRVAGELCTDVDVAIAASARGVGVILVRRETSPADIAGMAAARGILTSLGGLVSHAAVVARGWGVPAVVGAGAIEVGDAGITVADRSFANGTVITVDGDNGLVLLGDHVADTAEVPEVAILRSWARQGSGEAPSEVAGDGEGVVDPVDVERVLAIKGMGDAATVAAVLGTVVGAVEPVLAALVAAGDAQELAQGRVRLLPEAVARVDARFATEAAEVAADVAAVLGRFHAVNEAFKRVVTDWQIRTIGEEQQPNDHLDAEYDAAVVARLREEIHTAVVPLIGEAAGIVPRLAGYERRFTAALEALEAGDGEMFAHPLKDSYHTVWFELHEELIRLAGRNRADEAAAGRA